MADANSICSIEGCCNSIMMRGWCRSHYRRWQRHKDPLGGRIPQGKAARYLEEVVLPHADRNACLIWPYGRDTSGYGRVWYNGKAENVCRVVCTHYFGPPKGGEQAAHSCGLGHEGCVNPHHLRWATPKQNGQDRSQHKVAGIGRHKKQP